MATGIGSSIRSPCVEAVPPVSLPNRRSDSLNPHWVRGVERALEILRTEMTLVMQLIGVTSLSELTPEHLRRVCALWCRRPWLRLMTRRPVYLDVRWGQEAV